MMRNAFLASFLSLTAAMTGCTDAAGPVDELAGESDADGEAGKTDAAAEAFTFFLAEPSIACEGDPSCVGFTVSRPNRSTTFCSRGVQAASCNVALDWSATGFSLGEIEHYQESIHVPGRVLLRGEIVPAPDDRGSALKVRELWLPGLIDVPAEGVGVLVKRVDQACDAKPCPSLIEYKLNSNLSAAIGDLDLGSTGALTVLVDHAEAELANGGVIVFGDRTLDDSMSGAPSRSVNQFYMRVRGPL